MTNACLPSSLGGIVLFCSSCYVPDGCSEHFSFLNSALSVILLCFLGEVLPGVWSVGVNESVDSIYYHFAMFRAACLSLGSGRTKQDSSCRNRNPDENICYNRVVSLSGMMMKFVSCCRDYCIHCRRPTHNMTW